MEIDPLQGVVIAISIGVVLMILVTALYFHLRKQRGGRS
jgi:hypothetical protein